MARPGSGIGAGLDHERDRLERIAAGSVPLRPDLRPRQGEVVALLRQCHARAERLLRRLGDAPQDEAERIARLVYRAWRTLRNQIFLALEGVPSLGGPRPHDDFESGAHPPHAGR